jgi:hypothetical protein
MSRRKTDLVSISVRVTPDVRRHALQMAMEQGLTLDAFMTGAIHGAAGYPATLARRATLVDAFRSVERAAGCGNHGCCFKRPTGMATNGGCRCLGQGARPGMNYALRRLYRAAKAIVEALP